MCVCVCVCEREWNVDCVESELMDMDSSDWQRQQQQQHERAAELTDGGVEWGEKSTLVSDVYNINKQLQRMPRHLPRSGMRPWVEVMTPWRADRGPAAARSHASDRHFKRHEPLRRILQSTAHTPHHST